MQFCFITAEITEHFTFLIFFLLTENNGNVNGKFKSTTKTTAAAATARSLTTAAATTKEKN